MERLKKDREDVLRLNLNVAELERRSKNVSEYISLSKEKIKAEREMNLIIDKKALVFSLKKGYILRIEEEMLKLESDENVIRYKELLSQISEVYNNISTYMAELKQKCPELNSWIATNKKVAYFEQRIAEGLEIRKSREELKAANRTLDNLKRDYPESIKEWETLYEIKPHLFLND